MDAATRSTYAEASANDLIDLKLNKEYTMTWRSAIDIEFIDKLYLFYTPATFKVSVITYLPPNNTHTMPKGKHAKAARTAQRAVAREHSKRGFITYAGPDCMPYPVSRTEKEVEEELASAYNEQIGPAADGGLNSAEKVVHRVAQMLLFWSKQHQDANATGDIGRAFFAGQALVKLRTQLGDMKLEFGVVHAHMIRIQETEAEKQRSV